MEYFRDEWRRQGEAERFIFPRPEPTTQWDAFEYVKANAFLQLVSQSVPPGGRILEYGCGAAGILIFLTNHRYQGVALDATIEALQIARANDRAEGDPNRPSPITMVNANALAMPFGDQTFDCVVSNGLLEHFAPDIVPAFMTEVVRVLKPGGLFLADIVHARFSTRQVAKVANFAVSYLYRLSRGQRPQWRELWQSVSTPMYENDFDRRDWARALVSAGLMNVDVHGFRLPPPLSLPRSLDERYGRAIMTFKPLRKSAEVLPFHVPLSWVYVASGTRP